RFARAPYPLPLGALTGRRSLLALDNLVAAVDAVLAAPGPLRRPLIAADATPRSLPGIAAARRRGPRRSGGLEPVAPASPRTALARPRRRAGCGAPSFAQDGAGRGGPHGDL